jgi:signal transduction histidine kinase
MASVDRAELAKVPALQGLPEEELTWFLEQCEELTLAAGEIQFREDDPADSMIVVLGGEIQARWEQGGDTMYWTIGPGVVSGKLPFSRMTHYTVSARAIQPSRILRFQAARFDELIQRCPELVRRLVGVMSDRIREATRMEEQQAKLAALGKLSAGLAHELNNPASAAKRAASQMRSALQRIRDASHELGRKDLSPADKAKIDLIEQQFLRQDGTPPDTLRVSELEDQIDSALRARGFEDMWQLGGDLARRGFDAEALTPLLDGFDAGTVRAALMRFTAALEIWSLLDQIESSTSRISELVSAIKEYTYMDRAAIQEVNIVRSIENTLTILTHKLKRGITVHRDYPEQTLVVNSFGSELSQVWTNLIDNAVDAMSGKGDLDVKAFREDDCVVVEVGDNGSGIPAELQPRVFEPFFTTKAVGQGTGLGLDTVHRIVRKHKGTVSFKSRPGRTVFRVRLPISSSAVQLS